MTFYYECQLCGYPIPFDPEFDATTITSKKHVVQRDGMSIPTCTTVEEIAIHIEDQHPDQLAALNAAGDGVLEVIMNGIFKIKEPTQG